jgi:phosphatase and actin regulator 4
LDKKIGRRPSKVELEERNILKQGKTENTSDASGQSPLIDRRVQSFDARQQQLRSILKRRPDKEQLSNRNILKRKNKL